VALGPVVESLELSRSPASAGIVERFGMWILSIQRFAACPPFTISLSGLKWRLPGCISPRTT